MSAKASPEYIRLTEQALREDAAYCEAATPLSDSLTPEQKAENLHQLSGACYLHGATAGLLGVALDVRAWKAYLDNFLVDAGNPSDPLERLLLEQLVLAHHVVSRLEVQAALKERLEEVEAYLAAAARLMGEFRRSTLALQSYRQLRIDMQADTRTRGRGKKQQSTTTANGHATHGSGNSPHTEVESNNRLKGHFHESEPALS